MELKDEMMSTREILGIFKRRLPLIIASTLIAAVLSGVNNFLLKKPIYIAESQILINTSEKENKNIFVQEPVGTYLALINSPRVVENVADQLNMSEDKKALSAKIKAEAAANSRLITIKVKDVDEKRAIKIVNTLTAIFKDEVATIMKDDNVQIIQKATEAEPLLPENKVRNVVVNSIFGLMIGAILAYLLDYFSRRIRNVRDVERKLEVPVIGTVEGMDGKKQDYRILRNHIQLLGLNQDLKTLAITQPDSGEGKTIVATNLAVSLAKHGQKTVYVQADGENKVIAKTFNLDNAKGLREYFQGMASLEDIIHERRIMDFSFFVVPYGTLGMKTELEIASKKMDQLIKELKGNFDFVIIECPFLLTETDAIVLARKSDGCLLVLEIGSNREDAFMAKQLLIKSKSNLFGVVLNKQPNGKESNLLSTKKELPI